MRPLRRAFPLESIKMKIIQKYVADDGTEFAEQSQCITYEKQCAMIDVAMSSIPEPPEHSEQFIQLDRRTVRDAMKSMLMIALDIWQEADWVKRALHAGDELPMLSGIGRWIDDSGHGAFRRAWYRFNCIDNLNYRMWQQPYFAIQADKEGRG